MTRASTVRIHRLPPALLPLASRCAGLRQDDEEAAVRPHAAGLHPYSNIDQTDAIDDQNLIFYMRGHKVYRNHLPRKCPGLGAREPVRVRNSQAAGLCSIDMITVLEDSSALRRSVRGFTCRLGEFVPLSPEEVEELERQRGRATAAGRKAPSRLARSSRPTRRTSSARPSRAGGGSRGRRRRAGRRPRIELTTSRTAADCRSSVSVPSRNWSEHAVAVAVLDEHALTDEHRQHEAGLRFGHVVELVRRDRVVAAEL